MMHNSLRKLRHHIWILPAIIMLFSSALGAQQRTSALNLMPVPEQVVWQEGRFSLTDSFTVSVTHPSADRLCRYATRVLRRLSGRTGLFFSQYAVGLNANAEHAHLVLECQRIGQLRVNEDESYHLDIRADGIQITAATDIGVMRGLETLLQLVDSDGKGYFFPRVMIADRPRFPWRGLLLDVCRHFMPVEVIERNLDGMAAAKMNVLHWHLTEDQGFRVECRTFPRLHELGSDGQYFTHEQIREIIAYAADRGIRVVPEFDMPGHSTSWLVGYPELGSAPGPYEIQRRWGVHYAALNPAIEETYTFLDEFFAEMVTLFPDEYMHIGGDEVEGKHWDENEDIQVFMREHTLPDNEALQAHFNRRILDILTRHGRKMIGWDEIFQPGLPTDIVIQSWRGRESLYESARKGYNGILSNNYYIDLVQPADFHYLNDPLPEDAPLSRVEKQRIWGGEATMWAELVTPENVDSRIWPRTLAIAERLWSPPQVRDIDDMYRRLPIVSVQLEELGLTHVKNQEMMLRRLAGGMDIEPLKTLVDVVEPLQGYQRHSQGLARTNYSPLTRVVDTAVPEAFAARKFRQSVDAFLQGKKDDDLKNVEHWLSLWKGNHIRLKPMIDRSPVLQEIEPLSEHLSAVADIGLQAVERVLSGKKVQYAWLSERRRVLEQAKEPQGEVELIIVSGIEKLVDAVAARSGYRSELPSKSLNRPVRGWQFRQAGTESWHEAHVPGCVHTDLLSNHVIEDPFAGLHEETLQWIETKDWEYQTHFSADRELLARDRINLRFQGLDTYADVSLNGHPLFSSDNMFRTWTADCRNDLNEGDNILSIAFHSPVAKVAQTWDAMPYKLPGGPRVLTRKAAYQYGWDWGPRYVTSGIWRPVYLDAWDTARIRDLCVRTRAITEEQAEMTTVLEIESAVVQEAGLSFFLNSSEEPFRTQKVSLRAGTNTVRIDCNMEQPQLWWPNGLGAQPLYTLRAELAIAGSLVDDISRQFGIRTVEVLQEPDERGRRFLFKVNGVPVFMKGANYIPADHFVSRMTPEHYQSLIRDAAAANMNMLRVWGGGIYEDDAFYDLCDQYGLLVWQDFMFACAMYPGDPSYLKNVRQEAIDNIRRLRNHPCLALWCGNNEIDEAWHHWGWQNQFGYSPADSAEIWNNYERLFHDLLPSLVEWYDPGRFYWPSSPQFGRGNPRSLTEGDCHYWGVWHDEEPFEVFEEKTGRFMSEYGFQSFPEWETVRSFARPQDLDIGSPVMLAHQKHPRGNQLIKTYMERWYRAPKDFETFLYVSQLVQAEGMKLAIEAHRRAMPYCMGTLYWQLNDCWPVVSWSGIDYFGRWKALHYYARKAFADILVSQVTGEERLSISISSDRLQTVTGTLRLTLCDFKGRALWDKAVEVAVEPLSNKIHDTEDLPQLLRDLDRRSLVLKAELWQQDSLLADNLLYFVPPKDLDLPVPAITRKITTTDDGFRIELVSDTVARNVFLQCRTGTGFFSDNYFDMLPGQPVIVRYTAGEKDQGFADHLKVMSLVDSYEL